MSLEKNLNTLEQLNTNNEFVKSAEVGPKEAYDASFEDGKEKDAKTLAGEILQNVNADKGLSIELPYSALKDLKSALGQISSAKNSFQEAMGMMTLQAIQKSIEKSVLTTDYGSMMVSSNAVLNRLPNITQQLSQVVKEVAATPGGSGYNTLVNYNKALGLGIAYNKTNPENGKTYAENYASLLSQRTTISTDPQIDPVKKQEALSNIEKGLKNNFVKSTGYELLPFRDEKGLTDLGKSKLNEINKDPNKVSDRAMSIWFTILSYKRDNPKVPNHLVFSFAEAKYINSQEHTIATADAYRKATEEIEAFNKQQQSQPQQAPEVIASTSPTP